MPENEKPLNNLQENLAKDLVQLEENQNLSENELDTITNTYLQVYDIITEIKSL